MPEGRNKKPALLPALFLPLGRSHLIILGRIETICESFFFNLLLSEWYLFLKKIGEQKKNKQKRGYPTKDNLFFFEKNNELQCQKWI